MPLYALKVQEKEQLLLSPLDWSTLACSGGAWSRNYQWLASSLAVRKRQRPRPSLLLSGSEAAPTYSLPPSPHLGHILEERSTRPQICPFQPVEHTVSSPTCLGCFLKETITVEHIPKGNNCLDAAKACNLDDTCKKYRSAYITPCTTSMSNEVCNRRKCHKALRQFFDKVPAKHSYGMLFCSCRDIACTERRRQTIVPVCSYEEREKPNCLNLQDSCKTNYICRSRLADFFTNCQPESRSVSSCLKENYADCLLAYSGLIGTVMTPNYIDSSSLSVAPWCDCSNSGNDLEECLKFLNFFKDNTCLKNAIQAFGNGSDVTVWQPALRVQTTTATTTTTAFRVKNKPLGPAGSENEIPTHVLPPCANLQAQKLKSNVSGSTHLCLSDRDYEKDGLAGASSHITTKSMAAPPSCGLSPLLILVVTALSTLLSLSLAETL
ncbi:GDNF family receptor alpha-1 isoform X3 [Rousettus aegyptiacus]|uniref:GDNF family receptor alpha-1 isoform X3 n=1 Tax=Rousettus aegyptiacus TaxID=9407 RepID=UPI00168CB1AD|nr:GDNF family receptor alpha-1 isoform X3 [Rousettus aegyptiacus]